jgi:L-rhamnose mutarotase
MNKRRYCLALDLKNDEKIIAEYLEYHKRVWPEIEESLKRSGILELEIYHVNDRLFMIMEVNEQFSFETKKQMDDHNPIVQKWENLMRTLQKQLPGSETDTWWQIMNKIYSFRAD